MPKRKRNFEEIFEIDALKFVGFNSANKRMYRTWWKGYGSFSDVISEDDFETIDQHILEVVEKRGKSKKVKRYVLTGASSIAAPQLPEDDSNRTDANRYVSADSHCALFAVLNMMGDQIQFSDELLLIEHFPSLQPLRLFCGPAHEFLRLNLRRIKEPIITLIDRKDCNNEWWYLLEQGTHCIGVDLRRNCVFDCALKYPYALCVENMRTWSNIDVLTSPYHLRAITTDKYVCRTDDK